jgi:hypothetical protein
MAFYLTVLPPHKWCLTLYWQVLLILCIVFFSDSVRHRAQCPLISKRVTPVLKSPMQHFLIKNPCFVRWLLATLYRVIHNSLTHFTRSGKVNGGYDLTCTLPMESETLQTSFFSSFFPWRGQNLSLLWKARRQAANPFPPKPAAASIYRYLR